jgi:hypothetical protein
VVVLLLITGEKEVLHYYIDLVSAVVRLASQSWEEVKVIARDLFGCFAVVLGCTCFDP